MLWKPLILFLFGVPLLVAGILALGRMLKKNGL